ncbi:MAG: hypothetical protein LAQ69_03025 [Acidobacteriia bacterium]|nr:hypothetical protein [Terriglobia bacterium]
MSIAIWANSKDVPGVVCNDARLTDRNKIKWPWSDRPTTNADRIYGQAGWDVGINFLSLDSLASQLETLVLPTYVSGGGRRILPGEIGRLAIHAHGGSGTIYINGQDSPTKLTPETIPTPEINTFIHRIGLMTVDDTINPAVVLFVGCVAGAGKSGTALLLRLSEIWPNRKVVGFVSLGYVQAGAMARKGEGCNEPGMRDSTKLSPGDADDYAGQFWADLDKWPWASETSPRAKVAYNGYIVAGRQWL